MGNFGFLAAEWSELLDDASRAEYYAVADPRTSCFYARRTLELTIEWLYAADATLQEPKKKTTKSNLGPRLFTPTLRALVGPQIHMKMKVVLNHGNAAAHDKRAISGSEALASVTELFHVTYWLARRYSRDPAHLPADDVAFDAAHIPAPEEGTVRQATQAEVKAQADELARRDAELAEERRRNANLDAELAQVRAEVTAAKAANAKRPDRHDYNEDQTRILLIDLLLKEAGWPLDQEHDREFPVTGMPNPSGKGLVDYVLWDDDDRPLAVVEAKRTSRDAAAGQQQAKLYADRLEAAYGQRPVIFFTNGYEIFLWDDAMYPERRVQGFFTKEELRLLIHRRAGRLPLVTTPVNPRIAGRYYQERAIARIGEAFEQEKKRHALVVMATGAGKTRTTVALVDQLMRAGWVKRALFLADRQALVTQAYNAFKEHLPSVTTTNLLTERNADGRVCVSTYPTMMGLINETAGELRPFGPGYFDLVIVDEAHRSVYQKYGAIFDYFDALLLGLTATPKDEVDRNTYRLFHLDDGVPTDVYSLEDAANDGYLVLPKAVSVPLKFQREGIRYDDLSEDEKDEWDALEWNDDGAVPDRVEAAEIDSFLFNKDTMDKALTTLMQRGHRVAGGDRLGKTIIFAKSNEHADFIAERFNANYPEYKGGFARVITHKSDYAQDLIERFSQPDQSPHIAISVDMLDTGIDIPEVVNLVLYKLVRSKTKFWQMIGRGTRLCPDLYGPGRRKEDFLVFDLCQNFEFFNQDLAPAEGRIEPSLGERLLRHRLDLVCALDQRNPEVPAAPDEDGTEGEAGLRWDTARLLHRTVAGMNPDNFLVRPHLRQVEIYSDLANWHRVTPEERDEIAAHLAALPSGHREGDQSEEAKRFDLVALRLQLGRIVPDPAYDRLRGQAQDIAAALLAQPNLPSVQEEWTLLEEVAGPDWWVDVTLPMLETMRRRLRSLVRLIERRRRSVVYTDFEDQLGELTEQELRGVPLGTDRARFEAKARRYLHEHKDELAVQKLYRAKQVTATDIAQLERIFLENGVGTQDELDEVRRELGNGGDGLGLFVRSVQGLDREAANEAFDTFRAGRTLTANQLHFLGLIVDYLVRNGDLEIAGLYEPPFTTVSPRSPEEVFTEDEIDILQSVLTAVHAAALPREEAS